MRSTLFGMFVLCCGFPGVSSSEDRGQRPEAAEVHKLFACVIYNPGWRDGVRVVETAKNYAALRKSVSEITFPTPGVRRTQSKILRELGEFDFTKNRVVLICNASMADEIRVVSANTQEIRVRNVSTPANAFQGSATLVALAVPRGPKPPRVSWIGKAPRGKELAPEILLPDREIKGQE